MSRTERREMLEAYLSGKSSEQLARKYGVSPSYPRWLAHIARHGRRSRPRAERRGK